MVSSGMLRRAAFVKPDVSEEISASIISVTRIGELGTTLAIMMEVTLSSGTSVLTKATRRHIQEDGILHSHSHENLKSYIALTGWTL
jgi:hypothetical protein